ncbi:MAG: fatty acid desaturase [Deltaproteobacteria bacterium]|nr:fatty acid desaturase [Deltaproteobacteria bacterium]
MRKLLLHKQDSAILKTFFILSFIHLSLLSIAFVLQSNGGSLIKILFAAFCILFCLFSSSPANSIQHTIGHTPIFKSHGLNILLTFANSLINAKSPPFIWNVHHNLMHHSSNNGVKDVSRTFKKYQKLYQMPFYLVKFALDAFPIFFDVKKRLRQEPEYIDSPFIDKNDVRYIFWMSVWVLPFLAGIAMLTWWNPYCGLIYMIGMSASILEAGGLNYLLHAWDFNEEKGFQDDYVSFDQIVKSSILNVAPHYNKNSFHAGHHFTHHLYPRMHWTAYPAQTIRILKKLNEDQKKKVIVIHSDHYAVVNIVSLFLLGRERFLKKYRVSIEEGIHVLEEGLFHSKASRRMKGQQHMAHA